MRFLLIALVLPLIGSSPAGTTAATTTSVAADAATPERCLEACFYRLDANGDITGYGCVRGREGSRCAATVYSCFIDFDCIESMLTDESGTVLALDKRCRLFSPTEPSTLIQTPRQLATPKG